MKIYYRVLSVNQQDHSAVVRYSSEDQSEYSLRTDLEDQTDPPLRGRTDYTILFMAEDMTDDEIHKQIVSSCPVSWFSIKNIAAKGPTTSINNIQKLLNKTVIVQIGE
jgi:hypothetical protein